MPAGSAGRGDAQHGDRLGGAGLPPSGTLRVSNSTRQAYRAARSRSRAASRAYSRVAPFARSLVHNGETRIGIFGTHQVSSP